MAVSYSVKVPTASSAKSLGSGLYDHAFSALTNKSVRTTVLTFNATYSLVGSPVHSGFDRNTFLAGNFARPIAGPIGITGELYGATRLNSETKGYRGTLLGFDL